MFIKFCIKPGLITALLTVTVAYAGTVKAEKTRFNLQRWLIESVDNNPSVLAASAAVDASSFQLIAADKAIYNPELEIDSEDIDNITTTSIGISQTIDWGNTREARTEMASSQSAAARFGFESTRRNIAVDLLAGLSDYHTNSALKDLAEQGNKLMEHSAELAKQRFDAGDLGKVEVDLANLTYAQARFRLADATSNHARAVQNLIALTGNTDRNWPVFISELPDPKSVTQDADKVVQQLPVMREITSRVAAAQARIKVQIGKSSVNPTIAIRAGKEEDLNLVGLTFSIPLQVRNNFKAEVDAANAEMIQAEREAIDAYRKLKSKLEIAMVSYGLSREAWLAWEKSGAGSLSGQIKLLERLWKAGELSTTDYLVQLNQALDTKTSAIKQRGQMWTNWTEWLVASGKIEHWLPATNNKRENK